VSRAINEDIGTVYAHLTRERTEEQNSELMRDAVAHMGGGAVEEERDRAKIAWEGPRPSTHAPDLSYCHF
jgi:hypothetical protein